MSLTAVVRQRLESKGFAKLLDDHVVKWQGMAERARELMAQEMPTGQAPTIDDIRKVLLPSVELASQLRDHLANKRLSQQYWIADFTDYILHRVYQPKLQLPEA